MDDTLAKIAAASGCPMDASAHARALYATDASIYQVTPRAVAFPRTAHEAARLLAHAQDAGIPVTPRGGGTGLAGGALGDGIILHAARHNRGIHAIDIEARTARVAAGVVLDQLNDRLRQHGLCFGPDVATSSRATLGGMIANNSSGARAPYYGTTSDHVVSLELVLADGRVVETAAPNPRFVEESRGISALLEKHAPLIRERFHKEIIKRWPGFGIDRALEAPGDAAKLIGGSEGVLAAIFSATLRLSPLPREKGLALLFFADVAEAMEASVALLDLAPAAIEHIDDVLFDQTAGQPAFEAARALLELDAKPCKSILIVEFYEQPAEKIAAVERMRLGSRFLACTEAAAMNHVWNLRKAGLSLLTGCPGNAKPTAGVEDAAVPPRKLPGYVAGLREIMRPLGLEASFYGHAASGLLHVRPVVDLRDPGDIAKFRQVADGVAALTRQYRGALAAEHGVGMARTEYMEEQLGPEILAIMREIKERFDPKGLLNPGKILPGADRPYRIDSHLRQGPGTEIPLPFAPVLAFAAKDRSFSGNLEQCNGCGGCTKGAPTMCPTYIATGDELMSTRGRANTIRAVLEGRVRDGGDILESPALAAAMQSCLACKACTSECPSNVNMALLKAELDHARQRARGVSLRERLISRVDLAGRAGAWAPGIANFLQRRRAVRGLMEWAAGFAAERPLPEFAAESFGAWFRRAAAREPGARGDVMLWDDCFCRYYDSNIGQAAVRVLEAAGYRVRLPEGRACCGRPAFSAGRLGLAREFGARNIALLAESNLPVVFLEPSCWSMFAEDYRELALDGAESLRPRARLFEDFLAELLAGDPGALRFDHAARAFAVHTHCHAKSLGSPAPAKRLLEHAPGAEAALLASGCCGMAGAFGQIKEKYALSLAVARPLLDQLEALPPETCIVASGTSCRHQITHLSPRKPLHIAEALAAMLGGPEAARN